jgi:16S rRNA (cytosine1402-N4)-methyltransferase
MKLERGDYMAEYKHIPVLLNETIEGLNIKPNGIYVDCTMGGAGHSSVILSKIPNGHLYCFDQDEMVIEKSKARLESISNNFSIINENFINIKSALEELGVTKVDGILYDLGVSSFQLDIPERGFSYQHNAPLDMRMDQTKDFSAYDVVNSYSEQELKKVLYEYGEEKFASLIVKKIIKSRPIETTYQLVDVIKSALPAAVLRKEKHPAKKTFQAIRIEVNKELIVFRKSLEDAFTILNKNGRIAVITFHSLEDRICKHMFKEKCTLDLPHDLPVIPEGYTIDFELVNKKAIIASQEELAMNNRSHSAKLRVIERISN